MLLSLFTGVFFLVLLLDQQWSPPLRLQVSDCSTFHIMCDVPRIAVICREPTECFPGMASKFFLKPFVTNKWLQLLLVLSYNSGSTFIVSLYTNSCILALFHFLLYNTSVCRYCHIYQYAFFHFFVFNYIWPICCNCSVRVYCLIPQHCNIFLFIQWLECMCTICLLFQCLGLCCCHHCHHYYYCCCCHCITAIISHISTHTALKSQMY